MPDSDLSDDERALIDKHRKSQAETQARADADLRVWIRNDKGEEAEVPYGKGRGWLQKAFGIDLDAEPVQDATDDSKPDEGKPGEVRRFGRRMA